MVDPRTVESEAGLVTPAECAASLRTVQAMLDEARGWQEELRGSMWDELLVRRLEVERRKALELAERGRKQVRDTSVWLLDIEAAAYAATGQYDKARETATKALELCVSTQQPEKARLIEARLALYAAGRPYEEPLPTPWKP